jgi:ADP-ribose pyrophosphatase
MDEAERRPAPDAWRVLAERVIYERRPWLKLSEQDVELPSGVVIQNYLVTEVPEVAMIFALTEERDVLFVEQYKHGLRGLSLDLPAGYIDEEDPSPFEAARRELLEETGYESDDWTTLASLAFDPNRSTARMHYFLARGCRRVAGQSLDSTEDLLVQHVPLDALAELAANGRVRTVSTAAGIALATQMLCGCGTIQL